MHKQRNGGGGEGGGQRGLSPSTLKEVGAESPHISNVHILPYTGSLQDSKIPNFPGGSMPTNLPIWLLALVFEV